MTPSAASLAPPHADARPQTFTLHCDTRIDAYAWMRDKNDPAVIAHLEAENAYTDAVTAPARGLQASLYDAMLARIKQTDLSVPYRRGDFWYYARTQEGRQYPVYCRRRDGSDDAETVLLDLNEIGAGEAFIALGDFLVSDDGTLLAYSLDLTGYRQYTLRIMEIATRAQIGEAIELVDGVVWASDNRTLLYVTQDRVTNRTDTLWRTTIDGAQPPVAVYHEGDELFDLGIDRTRDGSTIVVTAVAKDTTECRYLSADRPAEAPALFAARRDGVRYAIDVRGDRFYIQSNDEAPDFAIYTTARTEPARERWTTVVPARPGTTVRGFELFAGFAAVIGRRDGPASADLLDYGTHALTPLPFDEADYVIDFGENEMFHATKLRFTYESLVTPRSVYDIDVATGRTELLKQTEVPGYDPGAYVAERIFVRARDGADIPISLVRRRDVAIDGSAPLLLYGYGSYGISIDPHFSAPRTALLDRGVIYAIAHIRGGGEYGEAWRLAGNLTQKMTTFNDFIDCADGLIAARYTTRERLAIMGGSAGGLLVGATLNLRPDICAAAIAAVPFVDVLTTMLDATLPLTTGEYREWGNPSEPDAYAYMRTYSPLDNVRTAAYPALLVEVSLNDSQVPFWEGAKLVAKLRAYTTGTAPILLKTNLSAGHGGSSGRYDRLHEIAFEYAFVLHFTRGGDILG